jgi:hypothetical protein
VSGILIEGFRLAFFTPRGLEGLNLQQSKEHAAPPYVRRIIQNITQRWSVAMLFIISAADKLWYAKSKLGGIHGLVHLLMMLACLFGVLALATKRSMPKLKEVSHSRVGGSSSSLIRKPP